MSQDQESKHQQVRLCNDYSKVYPVAQDKSKVPYETVCALHVRHTKKHQIHEATPSISAPPR